MKKTEKFILPPGVSGFYKENENTPSLVDIYLFRKFCENLAEKTGFQLYSFYDFSSSNSKSYHLAIITKSESEFILIFCNKYYPLIAFSKVLDSKNINQADFDLPKNEFFDDEKLASYFKTDFKILNSDFLSITVDADNEEDAIAVKELTFYEFAEFSFWKPQVLAEIIFNNWG